MSSGGILWQNPFVNVFKHFGVGKWKKCSKEGDISTIMDRDIKATVFRVNGSIPASNFIFLPKTSSQSLNLTGGYFLLLFKPLPSKYFVVHLEVVTSAGLVVRVSFSNLFKEFKSTSTWLQFPFRSMGGSAGEGGVSIGGSSGSSQKSGRWTFLSLNLKEILSKYLLENYAYLKNIKLCANILVKGVFTSDQEYCPLQGTSQHFRAVPREMNLPVPKGADFLDVYDYICFPCEEKKLAILNDHRRQLKGAKSAEVVLISSPQGEGTRYAGQVPMTEVRPGKSPRGRHGRKKGEEGEGETKVSYSVIRNAVCSTSHVTGMGGLADHMIGANTGASCIAGGGGREGSDGPGAKSVGESSEGREGSVHVYAQPGTEVTLHRGGDPSLEQRIRLRQTQPSGLQPDPILKLNRVIGFGGVSTNQALFQKDGTHVIYPCHSLVVAMDTTTGEQRFFTGHTNKVSCIALSTNRSLLASGQTGSPAVVRVWEVESGRCLALFQGHHQGIHILSFSSTSTLLCGVGKDAHGKSEVVLWDTSQLLSTGEVCVLTRAHVDVSVERMRIADFESHRMVSCGLNNVRFWRLKDGSLRSCAVDLGEHHHRHFTDIQFQHGYHRDTDLSDRSVYVCTDSGHLLELNYKRMVIQRVWHLLPEVAIYALATHDRFCVTGSEDGVLRVWPLDFSAVFMEAEHEGEVTALDISEDGLKILAGTDAGNLGILDASTKRYCTIMRSHVDHVTDLSVSRPAPGYLITCSTDHTIRVWDLPKGEQTYDFRCPDDCASCVCAGPQGHVFASGFTSGAIRVFQLPSTDMLAECNHHSGHITGLLYSPSGHLLYSASSSGSLALYSCQDSHTLKLRRLLANTLAKWGEESSSSGQGPGPGALSLNQDGSRLAFIGPHNFTISVLEAETLNEVLRIDITPVTSSSNQLQSFVDSGRLVCFTPSPLDQLLLVTQCGRLLKFSASNGQLLNAVGQVHRETCSSLAVSENGRYLLTAGDEVLKVWDYSMSLQHNFQVFIGHSGDISQVTFNSNSQQVMSCGDAIFIWDFLGVKQHAHSTPPSSPRSLVHGLQSASPRKRVPAPTSYDPLKMQTFTPLPLPSRLDSKGDGMDVSDMSHVGSHHPAHQQVQEREGVDEQPSGEEEEGGEEEGRSEGTSVDENRGNINQFCPGVTAESAEDDKTESTEEEDVPSDSSPPPVSSESSEPSAATPPSATVHLLPPVPRSGRAPRLYLAPQEEAGLRRTGVSGVSSVSRNSVVWHPNSGLFAFGSGCLVVVEDLADGKQRHLEGHSESISTLALQQDGAVLASASYASVHTPCEIRIWTLASGKCTKVLTFHHSAVQSMGYSPDNRFLLSIGNYQDGTLALWSAVDYSLLCATPLSHPCHAHCWDPHMAYEFTTVGAGQKVGGVSFWMLEEDMGGKKCQLKLHEPEIPADLCETQTGSSLEFTSVCYGSQPTVFAGSNNGIVSMWDTTQNACLLFWRTVPYEISCMLAVDCKLLTGTSSGSLQLWMVDRKTTPPGVALSTSMEIDSGAVTSTNFNAKLELGVVGCSSGAAWYINWSEQSKLKLIGGHSKQISAISFSTINPTLFASSALDGSLAVWNRDTREQLVLFQAPHKACCSVTFAPTAPQSVRIDAGGVEEGVAPAPPPLPALVAGYSDGTLRVFDVGEGGRMVRKIQPHAQPVSAVSYFNDDNVLMSGCAAGLVAISNLKSGLVIRVISDHRGAPITDLQTAPKPIQLPALGEKQCLLWLVASADRRISLWSADWQRDLCQLVDWLTFPGPPTAPDGTRLKKGSQCQYELLPPTLARFSPSDPDIILCTGYGLHRNVQFYSISSKTVFRTLALTHWTTSFTISPQGHLLAFGSHERVLKLMDYEEGSFQDFTGHHDSVEPVTFSPCGRFLVSACQSCLHFWDVILQ